MRPFPPHGAAKRRGPAPERPAVLGLLAAAAVLVAGCSAPATVALHPPGPIAGSTSWTNAGPVPIEAFLRSTAPGDLTEERRAALGPHESVRWEIGFPAGGRLDILAGWSTAARQDIGWRTAPSATCHGPFAIEAGGGWEGGSVSGVAVPLAGQTLHFEIEC